MPNTQGATRRFGIVFAVLVTLTAGCSLISSSTEEKIAVRPGSVPTLAFSEAMQRVGHWLELREHLQAPDMTELRRVQLVNDFFNRLDWRPDLEAWQLEDYWATPLETLLNNGGDCEDLAIAKYFTLLGSGLAEDSLRLSYAWQGDERQAHMVLSYTPAGEDDPLVLDNINKRLQRLSRRNDLELVYSFNGAKLWLAADALQPLRIASQDKLSKWRQVNERMATEAWPLPSTLHLAQES